MGFRSITTTCQKASTLSQQIQALFDAKKLSSASERLRFLACEQIERLLSGIFCNAHVMPFGSSVNSFGKLDSDLDMAVLHPSHNRRDQQRNSSRLVFQSKASKMAKLSGLEDKTILSFLNFAIHQFLPGCRVSSQVYNARVPIIKFKHEFLNLECDLSNQASGFDMSGLLYTWGHLDDRVRPLVFAIR